MSIQQTRTCRRCRRESLRDAKFCAQCGADLTPFARRAFIIALGLTSLVFILTPIYLVSSIDPVTVGLFFGLPYIAALLFITFLMAVYSGGAAIISAVIRRNNRSAARGVLVGVGVGLLFGVASCTASFAVYVWRAIHASLSLRKGGQEMSKQIVGLLVVTVALLAVLTVGCSDDPTPAPTATPTPAPTSTPTLAPAATPTPVPTSTPTLAPAATPTPALTSTPTLAPTATPTPAPTSTPTLAPAATPTPAPTSTPTLAPAATPTPAPTSTPTPAPTATPTPAPTSTPTLAPTATPTPAPTSTPTPVAQLSAVEVYA